MLLAHPLLGSSTMSVLNTGNTKNERERRGSEAEEERSFISTLINMVKACKIF